MYGTRAERRLRDTRILELYVSGNTPAAIAVHPRVQLSVSQVNRIVKVELDRAAKDHILRDKNARTIYMARMEVLIREAMAQAEGGDLKAVEAARRLLADKARIDGLADDDLVRTPVPPPVSDNELASDAEPAQVDDLAAFRVRRGLPEG